MLKTDLNDIWKQLLVVLQQLLMCLSGRTKGHLALTRLTVKRQEKPLYLYFSFGTFCNFTAYVQSCTFVFFTQGHSIWKRLNMHVIHIIHPIDASLSTPFLFLCILSVTALNPTSWSQEHTCHCFALLLGRWVFITKLLGWVWLSWVSLYLFGTASITN